MGKDEFDIAFGKALKVSRQNASLSQWNAASQAGFNHSVISKYESGDRTPTPYTVNNLATTYGTSAGEIYTLANCIYEGNKNE